jgi:histidyl-tRNA synthetase
MLRRRWLRFTGRLVFSASGPFRGGPAVLLGKGGGENERLMFKVLKRGADLERARASGEELADMGLRYDLTVPLARFYSRFHGQLPSPFKAFQLGPVWRAERAQKGRFREFWQCDVDVIGSESWHVEVEVISAVVTAIRRLGIECPRVLLNDRRLVYALLDGAGGAGGQTPRRLCRARQAGQGRAREDPG